MILEIFVLRSPRPFLMSRTAFLVNLAYWAGVFAKANTMRPSGPACCWLIREGSEDCWDSVAVSLKSRIAIASASSFVYPSLTKELNLFL